MNGLGVPVPPPPLRLGHCLERLAGLGLAGELLHQLAAVGADPTPIPHKYDPAELIPFDQERVEPWPSYGREWPRQVGYGDQSAASYLKDMFSLTR